MKIYGHDIFTVNIPPSPTMHTQQKGAIINIITATE